jgi:hypothetical protein
VTVLGLTIKKRRSLSICLSENFTGGVFVHDGVVAEKIKIGDAILFDDIKSHMVSQIFLENESQWLFMFLF